MLKSDSEPWSPSNSADLYQVDRWSCGFFQVESNGHLHANPNRNGPTIDIMDVISEALKRGFQAPLLVRFPEIAKRRLWDIQEAFENAIENFRYPGKYTCVYPIKVSQHRRVVDAIMAASERSPVGLEAGSKAELLAVLSVAKPGMPILCNGFKDTQYIEMALRGRKMGYNVFIIIEKPSEFQLAHDVGERLGVRPQLGMRVKLAARGSGHWEATGGAKSKFGLTATELVRGIQQLRDWDMIDCVKLLHFHLGSQIPNIRRTKAAVIEATRVFCDVVRNGVKLEMIDVGGGLGIDYSGSQNTSPSSMNYTLQEYANDVVYYIQSVCEQSGISCPNILSESGRALVAHQSMLIFPVFGSTSYQPGFDSSYWREHKVNQQVQPLVELQHALQDLDESNLLENYHDGQQALEIAVNLFNSGYLGLHDRAMAESMFKDLCTKVHDLMFELDFVPRDLENLQVMLADIYYANFSLFRSMPDHWAIGQLFPILPLHRLEAKPTRRAILSDITCDSDGKMARFIDLKGERSTLPLHVYEGGNYYLGAFLVGAYQEILGDNHNLMGDVHVCEVVTREDGGFDLDVHQGKMLGDVLVDVQYDINELRQSLEQKVQEALATGHIESDEKESFSSFYDQVSRSYTYLELEVEPASVGNKNRDLPVAVEA